MMYAPSLLTIMVAALACTSGASASKRRDHKKMDAELQLDLARVPQPVQRQEFIADNTAFKFNFAQDGTEINNEAVLQLQVTKADNQFLSTLAKDGEAQFLTVLKPCGILLPHVHPRANEFYSVIFGRMSAGVSQENGFAQDIVLQIDPGEVFVAPQGLMHFNHNQECKPNVFFQSFDSADPGALNVVGALGAFNAAGGDGAAAMAASGADSIEPIGAFALDRACLKRCGFPKTGAPGDGLDDLPKEFKAIFGL